MSRWTSKVSPGLGDPETVSDLVRGLFLIPLPEGEGARAGQGRTQPQWVEVRPGGRRLGSGGIDLSPGENAGGTR